jgi:hypothetical protein
MKWVVKEQWTKVKVKVTLVQALIICTGRTSHRGSRDIALLFHDHGTRKGWGDSVTPPPLFNSGKEPVTIVKEAGWAPGPVWTGVENLASIGIRFPDRPVRIQSLYQLRYSSKLRECEEMASVVRKKERGLICIRRNGMEVRKIQVGTFQAIGCTVLTLHQVIITCFSIPRNFWSARAWGRAPHKNTLCATEYEYWLPTFYAKTYKNLLPR